MPSLQLSTTVMAAIIRWGRQLIQRPPSPPKQLRSSHFHSISSSQLIEEENLPYYKPEQFYPVRIGEVLNSDYQVLGKLEYGAYSTVWFCRDLSYVSQQSSLKLDQYVTVITAMSLSKSTHRRTLNRARIIGRLKSTNIWASLIRYIRDKRTFVEFMISSN